VRIHLAGKHALEFQRLDFARERIDVGRNGLRGAFVVFRSSQLQQFFGPAQAFRQAADAVDDLVELSAFLAELLRALGLIPDVRIFQLAADFLQAFALGVVVKDTPVTTRRGWSGRRYGRQSD